MDPDDDRSGLIGVSQRRIGMSVPELAIGGLSLADFRQDMALAAIETGAPHPAASGERSKLAENERAARKKFRQHEDRERRWAAIRSYQVVPLDSGWRRAGRGSVHGGAVSYYDIELFGQIRPNNSRHPKQKSNGRANTALVRLLQDIVDSGLERRFLHVLSQQIVARAKRDPGLVRQYALLVAGSGFNTPSVSPVGKGDDDPTFKSGDNKRIAEQLTALGFSTSTRDVENTKKRLDRLLLDVGALVIGRKPTGKASLE